jgi:hypothetical protein
MMKSLSSYTFGAVSIGALALTCGACSTESTQVTDVWKDPSYAAGPMKNIVVFGARLNETQRRTLEDGFVSALAQHNTRATQSYKILPSPLPSADAARAMLQQSGFDGVLVAQMRGMNETVTDVGTVGFWGGYYGPAWGEPYVVAEPVVKFETSLWDPSGAGKVVWSAITQTDNPSSGKDFTASLTKQVIPMMEKAGLISPIPGQPVSYQPYTSYSSTVP